MWEDTTQGILLPDDLKKFIPTRSQLQQRAPHQDKKRRGKEKHREVARNEWVDTVSRGAVTDMADANDSKRSTTRNANSPQRSKGTSR